MLNRSLLFLILLVTLGFVTPLAHGEKRMNSGTSLLDFSSSPAPEWYVVNDGVMGGISKSSMRVTDEGTGEFSGELSLEYNGGFASVRTVLPRKDYSSFGGVELRIKGDGRTYQLRFRVSDRFDGVSYRSTFFAPVGEWTTVRLAFVDFEPTYRGRVLDDQPPLNTEDLQQLIFMLADKKPGPFNLEIESVKAWDPKEA